MAWNTEGEISGKKVCTEGVMVAFCMCVCVCVWETQPPWTHSPLLLITLLFTGVDGVILLGRLFRLDAGVTGAGRAKTPLSALCTTKFSLFSLVRSRFSPLRGHGFAWCMMGDCPISPRLFSDDWQAGYREENVCNIYIYIHIHRGKNF